MKKKTILITIAIFYLFAFSLQAGIRIGVKGGVNLANAVISTSALQSENFTGFQVGPIIELSAFPILSLDAAILYSQQGLKIKDYAMKNKVSALDVPVNLKFKLSLLKLFGIYVSTGPYASFKFDNNNKISLDQIQSQWRNKQYGVGVNFGGGFELLKHLQVGANYQLGLSDDYRSNVNIVDNLGNIITNGFNAKTRIWSITATYFF